MTSRIENPWENITRDVFDDKGISLQAKGSVCKSSLDMLPKWKDIRSEFAYERVSLSLQAEGGK